MRKFSIPDEAVDITLMEQAVKNEAIIVVPEYSNPDLLVESYQQMIDEYGFRYSNGNKVQVMTYMDFLSREGNKEDNIVILNPDTILLEILDIPESNAILIENNDYM